MPQVEYLVHAIAVNPAIKQLVLAAAGLQGEKHLHSLVTFGPYLTHLDLSHNRLGEKGAVHLARALQVRRVPYCDVRRLPEQVIGFSVVFSQGLEPPPPPKSFDLSEAHAPRPGGCSLQVLKLSGCDLNANALSHLRVFLQSRAWARSLHTLAESGRVITPALCGGVQLWVGRKSFGVCEAFCYSVL